MSAQLRRSARRRKNMSIATAASARKKANQRVPATTVDSAIISATSSAGISTMSYSQAGAGIYTSASTCSVASMRTANTLLYSKVPDQREFNTVISQDPPEHSLGVMSTQLRRSARRRKNMSIATAASARKKANQRVPATTVDSAIISATSSAGISTMSYSHAGAGIYTSATNMNQNSRNDEDEDENDPLVDQSEDGGIIIANDVAGETIRHTAEELNIRYPDKTSEEYIEYLENSKDYNKDYLALTKNDLKKRYLYQNLVTTVGTEIDMRNRQQLFIILDMISNVRKISTPVTQISSGSLAEGLVLQGSDTDIMYIIEDVDVKQDASNIENPVQRATFVMEPDTDHPGFNRLRLIAGKDKESQFINSETFESITTNVYLSPKKFISNINLLFPELSVHGPSLSDEDQNWDFVFCIRIKYLPQNAMPWVSRKRQKWPPSSIIDMISKNGCLLVAVGPRALPESSLLWRVSFSLAEKQLVHSFNYTQLLCYCLLKLTLKHIVNKNDHAKDLLCSYFLKTALFWVSEEVDIDTFQLSKLSICFSHCLEKLISWVNKCFCPNYFIRDHNMFQGKISPDNNTILTSILNGIKDGGVDGLLYTLYSHDNGAYPLLNTKNESSLIELELFIYVRSWAHAITDDDSLYFEKLEVIKSLLKSRSSKLIIDVCKFRHACISQFAAQKLPPLSTISETYNIRKLHELLQDGLNTDAVSGWLLYASYYYVTGQFNVTLKLTDKVLEKCSPEMLLVALGDYSEKSISNYRNHVHSTMTMCEKMRKAFISDVRYIRRSSLIPVELQQEVEDKDIFIPPNVMSHCLRVLCYHHLGDISNRQKSLHDFRKDVRLQRPGTSSCSKIILGVCCEISGEDRLARELYCDVLRCDGRICHSAVYRLFHVTK